MRCSARQSRVLHAVLTVASGLLFFFCLFFVFYGILAGRSNFFPGVPVQLQLVLFIVLVFCLGCLEGTQISFVKTVGAHIEPFAESHPRAFKNILFASRQGRLQAYLMGRQLLTIAVVFLISRLTTFVNWTSWPFSNAPVPLAFKGIFYDSGLLGVVVVTIAGQLTPQLISDAFPVRTLNIRFIGAVTLCVSVALEKLGITHFAYALAACFTWLFKRINPRGFSGQPFSPVGQVQELSGTIKALLEEDHLIALVAEGADLVRGSSPNLARVLNRDESSSRNSFPPIIGGAKFASPAEISQALMEEGVSPDRIPRFLLSPTDPRHIPPHVVAVKLMGLLARVKDVVHFNTGSSGIREMSQMDAQELEVEVLEGHVASESVQIDPGERT